jgi:hypothetical protein
VRRRRLVDRGVEIVAKRRAERRLIAARDADRIDGAGPGAARVGAEQARDGARLRLQPLGRALRLGQRPATLRLDCASLDVALLGRLRLALGGGERLGGLGQALRPRRAVCLLKPRHAERAALARDSRIFRFEPYEAAPLFRRGVKKRPATGAEV